MFSIPTASTISRAAPLLGNAGDQQAARLMIQHKSKGRLISIG
jgi:hypothetical protein